MKFIHLSDLHLGFQEEGREYTDPFKSVSYAFDYAREKEIKLVVISGDIFDRRDPSSNIQKGFASILAKAIQDGIKIFIITGNHEGAPFSERSIHLDVYKELELPNVIISKKPDLYEIDGINFISLPYPFKRNLLSKEEYREKAESEILQILNEKLLSIKKDLLKNLKNKNPAVLVAHLPITEGKMNEAVYSRFDTDLPISVEELDDEKLSYIALGHYHKYQVITSRKFGHPFVYAGSLDRITFAEENDEKGFVEVEIDKKTKTASFKFVKNPFARKYYTIYVKSDRDVEEVDFKKAKESITRIVLMNDLENEDLLKALAKKIELESVSFFGILDKRERKTNFISSSLTLNISPKEAIEKYLKNKDDPFIRENLDEIIEGAMGIIKEVTDEK